MREIKLKIDQKFDVKRLLKEFLAKNGINEFYEKKMKADDKTISVFVFEDNYRKTVWDPAGKHIGHTNTVEVTATTTMIVSEKSDSTAVALIYSTDDKNDTFNSFDLMLKDNGFRYI